MARDIFVRFDPLPPREDVELSLKAFVSSCGTVVWQRDRWYISLPGKPEESPAAQAERWIEVYFGDHVDVITRMADEFTNSLASGLAKRLARQFGGRVESEC